MIMFTPTTKYAPHDLHLTPPASEMSPLNLPASGVPLLTGKESRTLPSLHSLNLITPPNSASQEKEHSFSSGRDSQDYGDMHFSNYRNLSTESSMPLFPTVTAEPVTSEGKSGLKEIVASHKSMTRRYFSQKGIRPPTVQDYLLASETFLFAKGLETQSNLQEPREGSQSRSPRQNGFHVTPERRSRAISSVDEDNHQSQSRLARESNNAKLAADARPGKRARLSTTKPVQMSKVVMTMEKSSSEVDMASPSKRTPRKRAHGSSISSSREPKHARNKSTKAKRSTDHREYPDYCPPWAAMLNPSIEAKNVKLLDVKNPIDLENDPLRVELHESEVIAAKRLNIGAGVYLCTKRQIFEGYVEFLKGNRPGNWNKTAAQNVVNLDVTKASALWQFYQDVGWFERKLFEQYL